MTSNTTLQFNPQAITILLIEDDDIGRTMATAMLRYLGFSVIQAQSGAVAVNIFQQKINSIQLVICDLTMPNMDGWETLNALRTLDPNIAFILTSGYDEKHAMRGTHPELPQIFLQKPFQMATILETIRKVLHIV